MKLTADVMVITPRVQMLKRCFDAELAAMQTPRSTVQIHTTKDSMQFHVSAADSIALRATLNTITKLLTVCQETLLKEEDHDASTRKDTTAANY